MRTIILCIFLMASVVLGCTRVAHQTITGTIQGRPALTLYGNSGKAADYMLLDSTQTLISYNGQLYTYYKGNASDIYISVATASIVSAILTQSGGATLLTITYSNTFFASTQYSSR